MEEINYKTLLRTTLIHKDCLLKIKPEAECNLINAGETLSFLTVSGLPLNQGHVPSTGCIIGVQSCCTGLLRVAKEGNRHYKIILAADQFYHFYQAERSGNTEQQLCVCMCVCVQE